MKILHMSTQAVGISESTTTERTGVAFFVVNTVNMGEEIRGSSKMHATCGTHVRFSESRHHLQQTQILVTTTGKYNICT